MIVTLHYNQINGNWIVCTDDDEHMDFYTKRDSLRITTKNEIAANWTNHKVKNDTIYFRIPGEWNDLTKAFMKYILKKCFT